MSAEVTEKRFVAEIERAPNGTSMFFALPFDPRGALGRVRAPVVVTIRQHAFRTTLARRGGRDLVVLNAESRAATRVVAGDRVRVRLALDTEPRVVVPPEDLARRLADRPRAAAAWERLPYTHRREHVEAIEEAKRPETRARRIDRAIAMLERDR